MNLYDPGDTVRASATFTLDGTPTNPTAVTATFIRPDGTTVSVSPTSSGTGVYNADYLIPDPAIPGVWRWKLQGTGVVASTFQSSFVVRATDDLVSLEQLKAMLGVDHNQDDARLYLALWVASAAVRSFTNRSFARANQTTTRTYQYDGSGWLEIDDASAITAVVLDGVTLSADYDFSLGPDRGVMTPDGGAIYEWIELRPGMGQSPEMGFERNLDTLWLFGTRRRYAAAAVTGTFGWPQVPADVQEAAILTASALVETPEGPFDSRAIDSYSYSQGSAGRDAIPPRAKELLSPYRRLP